jgi:hypothetical protein
MLVKLPAPCGLVGQPLALGLVKRALAERLGINGQR